MDKKEVKETKKAKKKELHKKAHKVHEEIKEESKTEEVAVEPKKRKRRNKKVEGYKRRNALVEVIIVCIILVALFFVACNKTFLKTNYTKEIGSSKISIDLPRFTYYVGTDDEKIVFKTLRKSQYTRRFFENYLETGPFDVYYCGDTTEPYYYNEEGKYFILGIDVTKKFAVKTITVRYSTVDYDLFCDSLNEKVEDNEAK